MKRDDLQQKYDRLLEKYEALVHKLEERVERDTAAFYLGSWAVHSVDNGLCLLVGARRSVCNAKWTALAGPTDAWRESGSQGERCTLDELARGLAARLGQKVGARAAVLAEHADGKYVELRVERVPHPRGGSAIAVMAHDVTARVKAERQLDEARQVLVQQERLRAIGQLASGVAHDLNNTLNAIKLRLTVVREDERCTAAQGDNLKVIDRIVDDAAAMVGRLQDFARQRSDLPLTTVDLPTVVAEALEIVRPELAKAEPAGAPVRIEAQLPTLPPVAGNEEELRHVLVNVLLNARDAMPRGGTVRVRGKQKDATVVLTVDDEGVGIPAEHLPRVFDPFFTTKGRRGTGLGLSMAYGVMSRLGGGIAAANRPRGGATITLTFPVRPAPAKVAAPRPVAPPDGHGVRVLLVDDDQDNLEATRAVLELEGTEVETADNGRAALQRVQAGAHFDLVLCDVGMPGMSGWQVAEALHELAPSLPVYMITGWAREIPRDDPRRRLVAGVLAKPLEVERLRQLVTGGEGATRH